MTLLAVGIDVVDIDRIRRVEDRNEGVFRRRVLGRSERELPPVRRVAARWAACVAVKEAFVKALGTGFVGSMRWTDVELVFEGRTPRVRVSGSAREAMVRLGAADPLVSVTTTRRCALAMVALTSGTGSEGSHVEAER